MTVRGTVELGGTKSLAAFGRQPEDIKTPLLVDTGHPETTLEAIGDYLDSGHVTALGVASFGPVELRLDHERFGYITRTPKREWALTDIVGFFKARLGVSGQVRYGRQRCCASRVEVGRGNGPTTVGLHHGWHGDRWRIGHRRTPSAWNTPSRNGAHDRSASF